MSRFHLLHPLIFFFFLSSFLLGAAVNAFGWLDPRNPHSALAVEILMEKQVYEAGEPLSGKIIVENKYPAKLSGVFHIALIHDGTVKSEFTTAIKTILTGKTEFSLKSFGIPEFSAESDSGGTWNIRILQQNLDPSFAEEATIFITAR